MLMHMLIEQTEADNGALLLVAMVNEGREVANSWICCALRIRRKMRAGFATSDLPSVDRCNAAQLATTVAEYFRDEGKRVVLFIDSMTRYARAFARRGTGVGGVRPVSIRLVFDNLPAWNAPGRPARSITAFYTGTAGKRKRRTRWRMKFALS